MATTASAIKRLNAEYIAMQRSDRRCRELYACPLEENIFEWHFTIIGPEKEGLPYDKGLYHGILRFPHTYPFAPPDVLFLTPNGRFETHTVICTSISSFHKDQWRPSFDVFFVLSSLRLFMAVEEVGVGSIPSSSTSPAQKLRMAEESWDYTCTQCRCRAREVWMREMVMYAPMSAEKESAAAAAVASTTAKLTKDAEAATPRAPVVAVEDAVPQPESIDTAINGDDEVALDNVSTADDTPSASPYISNAAAVDHVVEDTPTAAVAETSQRNVIRRPDNTGAQPTVRIHVCGETLSIGVQLLDQIIVICAAVIFTILLRWTVVWFVKS